MKMFDGKNLTFGSDIEFILFHHGTKQNIPATCYNTPETSENRGVIESKGETIGTFHRDNITVEIQTTIHDTPDAMVYQAIRLRQLLALRYEESIKATLLVNPVGEYAPDMLKTPEAQEMGCLPDVCAYSGEEKAGPKPVNMDPIRVCSGHIHVGGLEDLEDEQRRLFVRWFDALVVLPLLAHERADAWKRRQHYGQAGRFRYKDYGVELRAPSNSWLNTARGRPQRIARLFREGLGTAYTCAMKGVELDAYGDPKHLRTIINDYNGAHRDSELLALAWKQSVSTFRYAD